MLDPKFDLWCMSRGFDESPHYFACCVQIRKYPETLLSIVPPRRPPGAGHRYALVGEKNDNKNAEIYEAVTETICEKP